MGQVRDSTKYLVENKLNKGNTYIGKAYEITLKYKCQIILAIRT